MIPSTRVTNSRVNKVTSILLEEADEAFNSNSTVRFSKIECTEREIFKILSLVKKTGAVGILGFLRVGYNELNRLTKYKIKMEVHMGLSNYPEGALEDPRAPYNQADFPEEDYQDWVDNLTLDKIASILKLSASDIIQHQAENDIPFDDADSMTELSLLSMREDDIKDYYINSVLED